MQIKCGKCGQSFSTVTSLSKHKRFCDSTGSLTTINALPTPAGGHSTMANLPHQIPSHHPQLASHHQQQFCSPHPSSVAAAAAAAAAVANPFLMYNRHFQFPPNLAAAYQGLFNHHAGLGAATTGPQRAHANSGLFGSSPIFSQLMTPPRTTADLRLEVRYQKYNC